MKSTRSGVGIEMTLQSIANLAWRYHFDPSVCYLAGKLLEGEPTVARKVQAVVNYIHEHGQSSGDANETFAFSVANPSLDADDAVLAAAAICMAGSDRPTSIGIPCRIVGARFGQSWTCWLAYQDGDEWVTIDVVKNGQRPTLEPDEQVIAIPQELAAAVSSLTVRLRP